MFIPVADSLWRMRREAKRSILAGAKSSRFFVAREIDYYPGMIDRLLRDQERLNEELEPYREELTGRKDGALRCIALWDMRHWMGLLLHRDESGLSGAHLPVVTEETMRTERDFAEQLKALSLRAEREKICVEVPVPSGVWPMQEILRHLSEWIG